jgi:hypothetical protein
VAGNLVKMVTGYNSASPPPAPACRRAALAAQLGAMRLQAPAAHSGLAVAVDGAALAPVASADFTYAWYRQWKQGGRAERIQHTDPTCSWYPPSADDIGMSLCVKCTDNHSFNLQTVLVARIDRPDPALVAVVEEAIDMNRFFVKKAVVSVCVLHDGPRESAADSGGGGGGGGGGENTFGSPLRGGGRRGMSSVGSMDEYDGAGAEAEDVDVPASVEATLDGILISERGGSADAGLLVTPSRRLRVACLHPNSLQITVPLQIGGDTGEGPGPGPGLQTQPSVRWLGAEQGALFEHLSGTMHDHHVLFEAYLRRQRRAQERRAVEVEAKHSGEFTVDPAGVTKLSPPRKPKAGAQSGAPPGGPAPGDAGHGGGGGIIDSDDAPGEPPAPIDGSGNGNALPADSSGFVSITEHEGGRGGGMARRLSEESLHAPRRAEMEQLLYREASLSLSSHGGDSSHGGGDGGSASGDELEEAGAGLGLGRRAPRQLTVRILCQDRPARDALVLCIRALVAETPSLPTPVPLPSSSPTVMLTDQQRKSFLPWRQIEAHARQAEAGADGAASGSVPPADLPIMHGSAEADADAHALPGLDGLTGASGGGEAQLSRVISPLEGRVCDLAAQRRSLYGVSAGRPPPHLVELQQLTRLCDDQKAKIAALAEQLSDSERKLLDRDRELAAASASLAAEKGRFEGRLGALRGEGGGDGDGGAASSLSKQLEEARAEVDSLNAKLAAALSTSANSNSSSSSRVGSVSLGAGGEQSAAPAPPIAERPPAPLLASVVLGAEGALGSGPAGGQDVLSRLEADILQVVVSRRNKGREGREGRGGRLSPEVASCFAADTSIGLDIARLLSEHNILPLAPPAAEPRPAAPDIAGMLDAIFYSSDRPAGRVPSFDAEGDGEGEEEGGGGGAAGVDSSVGFRPLAKPSPSSRAGGVYPPGGCSPRGSEDGSASLGASGHGFADAAASSQARDRSKSNLSEDNIFLEMSCALNDMLPPSEDTIATHTPRAEGRTRMGASGPGSREATPTSSPLRQGRGQAGSPRLLGAPPRHSQHGSSSRKKEHTPERKYSAFASPSSSPFRNTPSTAADGARGEIAMNDIIVCPDVVFPVADIIAPTDSNGGEWEEAMQLRMRVLDLEEALGRSEQGRQAAADKWPLLVRTFQDMKTSNTISAQNLQKVNQTIEAMTAEHAALVSKLSNTNSELQRVSGALQAKSLALKDCEKVHSEEVLRLCRESQELSAQHRALDGSLVRAEAAAIDLASQRGTEGRRLQEADAAIERLQSEVSSLQQSAAAAAAKTKATEAELSRAQKEGTGLKRECDRLKSAIATVQRNSEPLLKLKQELAGLQTRLAQSEGQSASMAASLGASSDTLQREKQDLHAQLAAALERESDSDSRIAALENELLLLSDSRQALSKQSVVSGEMSDQIKKLRQRLLEADQEGRAMQDLLSAKQEENGVLARGKAALEKEVETLVNTLEKRKARIEKLKVEAADCKALSEQSLQFDEERARLKGIIDSLNKDRTELYALRPQMAKLEGVNSDIKYERDLLNNQTKRQGDELGANSLAIGSLHSRVHALEQRQADLAREREALCMRAEDLRAAAAALGGRLCVQQALNDKLKEDLLLAYTADPIRVKSLNFMMAKLQGDKNHWENKVSYINNTD